ncbi:sensor histidine kinase [Cohnella sp. WQ 127256]|uniref:sensor histidine kinase n=1 Tax=Cohnella sp. WQ 127256 TaxID=2938790 RepID=UPI0021194CE8|nr:sensor histidine kinase [Cohnella sp. WQ 127256]
MKEDMTIPKVSWLKQLSRPYWALRKWLLLYLLVIVLPASVLLYSYYERSASILEEEVSHSMLQTLNQAGINLSYRIHQIENLSNSLLMNPNLYKYLGQAGENPSEGIQLDNVKDLRNLVDTVEMNSDVFHVRFFVDGRKLIASDRINFFSLESLQERPLFKQIINASGGIVWTGVYEESFLDKENTYIFSSARMIRDPQQYDTVLGVMLLDIQERTFADILNLIEMPPNSKLYIVDNEGTILWHPDRLKIGTTIAGNENGINKAANSELYTLSSRIEGPGWKLIADVPASEISRRALDQGRASSLATILGISAGFLAIMFILLAFMIRGMNRRLQQIIVTIRKEGVERLDEVSAPKGEFFMLEQSVDQLIHRVKQSMDQTYRAQVQQREAQLKALQAQINPHFLYNTLDTINWIAIGRNATDISEMIDALAKYFRLSLNKGRDMTSVADEIQLAQVYLGIQKNRFPSTFQLEVLMDKEVEAFFIPKLTLQPIVENALLHGIRKAKTKTGIITIKAFKENEDLVLEVTDDGIGMDEKRAQRLLTEPINEKETDSTGSSYGLFNVNERIKLFSGPTYGLVIRSRLGEGTTVTVRLKALTEDLLDTTRK